MNKICEYDQCTGCCACFNACPKNAISIKEDFWGALHPEINEQECINCNLCKKSCPVNVPVEKKSPQECFAAWTTDIAFREKCASGGIASILSKYVIEQGGVVYGACYDNQFNVHTKRISKIDDLNSLKGSKYTHCYVGDSYQSIKKDLQNGLSCLYISTPCQIAGLKAFLKKDYDNLITADLICHGVSPNAYLKQEIEDIRKKKNLEEIDNVVFRSNIPLKNFHFTLWNKGSLLYDKAWITNPYFRGFLNGITLRDNCYTCQYAELNRVGDFTLGDFIGIELKNTSLVLLNNNKAKDIWNDVVQKYPVECIKKSIETAVSHSPSLQRPYPKHPLYRKFRSLYKENGYLYAINKCLKWRIRLHESPISLLWRVPKKIWKKLGKNNG